MGILFEGDKKILELDRDCGCTIFQMYCMSIILFETLKFVLWEFLLDETNKCPVFVGSL